MHFIIVCVVVDVFSLLMCFPQNNSNKSVTLRRLVATMKYSWHGARIQISGAFVRSRSEKFRFQHVRFCHLVSFGGRLFRNSTRLGVFSSRCCALGRHVWGRLVQILFAAQKNKHSMCCVVRH